MIIKIPRKTINTFIFCPPKKLLCLCKLNFLTGSIAFYNEVISIIPVGNTIHTVGRH
ncbi:MAG: hypothetical protein E7222_12490 [Clostridiales bacterium]|nr:hypothetical protein [Clostridiales bacterium]